MLLEQISIPPAAELFIPKYTRAADDGVVGFVVDPVHEMLPPVILLIVNADVLNVIESDACPFICILHHILLCHQVCHLTYY